jgi:hypothetical protein
MVGTSSADPDKLVAASQVRGALADNHREPVGAYLGLIESTSEEFRRAADRLRDAVEQHQDARRAWVDSGQPI